MATQSSKVQEEEHYLAVKLIIEINDGFYVKIASTLHSMKEGVSTDFVFISPSKILCP